MNSCKFSLNILSCFCFAVSQRLERTLLIPVSSVQATLHISHTATLILNESLTAPGSYPTKVYFMEKTTESLYRISARSTNHRTQDNSKQYPLLLASLQHYLAEGFLQLSAEVLYLHTLTEINVPCFVPFCPTKLFSERLQTSLKSGLILTIISLKPRLYHVIHLKELLFSVSNRSSNSPFQLQFLETTQKQVFWLTIFFF